MPRQKKPSAKSKYLFLLQMEDNVKKDLAKRQDVFGPVPPSDRRLILEGLRLIKLLLSQGGQSSFSSYLKASLLAKHVQDQLDKQKANPRLDELLTFAHWLEAPES